MVSGEEDGTKRIGVDVSLTISHANYPFPPDFKKLKKSDLSIADEANSNVIEQALSETKDCYVIGILALLYSPTEFNKLYHEGIVIRPLDYTAGEYLPWLLEQRSPMYDGTNYEIRASLLYPIPVPVDKGNIMHVNVVNCSGVAIGCTLWLLYFEVS